MSRVVIRLRNAIATGTGAYGCIMMALWLNVPLLLAALSRYPVGLDWVGLAGVYAVLVFVGYYVLLLLLLVTALFLVAGVWPRLFVGACGILLTLALYYLVANGVVYGMLRMHIDAFWLQYLFTTFAGVGFDGPKVSIALGLLVLIGTLEWWVFRWVAGFRHRLRWGVALATVSFLAFAASQVLHIAAYEANDTRITALTPQLPFYYPMTSHRNAVKYGGHLAMIREVGNGRGEGQSLSYPLADVQCDVPPGRRPPNILLVMLESWRADAMNPSVTPRMHAFAQSASVFTRHFSAGNSTPTGVFPLFYGIHPTYWNVIKANGPAIDNPVLIDVLRDNGYAFGIYAKSNFERHKIKETVFRGIEVREMFAGDTPDANDRDLTNQLFQFMENSRRADRPFLGFAFYKSTHFPYDYPPTSAPFQPARELNVLRAGAQHDPGPVLNDYRNAVHYVDGLVGGLLDRMRENGLLENTLVVITSDHGEEFNDNGHGYWGHTGNFTEYQTRVPLIVYVPWRQPRRISAVTTEVDIAPTLLEEGIGCGVDPEGYSNGVNLFGPLEAERPVVVASYVNHALITGDDVSVIWPMYVQRYKLHDIGASAIPPSSDLMRRTLEEMTRFHGGGSRNRAPPAGGGQPRIGDAATRQTGTGTARDGAHAGG